MEWAIPLERVGLKAEPGPKRSPFGLNLRRVWKRLANRTMLLAAIATGACVALCGAIGFVGLIAPIIARHLTKGHPGRAILPAGLLGAGVLLFADLVVRFAPAGRDIPIGVITSLIGTPIFILVLARLPRGGRA